MSMGFSIAAIPLSIFIALADLPREYKFLNQIGAISGLLSIFSVASAAWKVTTPTDDETLKGGEDYFEKAKPLASHYSAREEIEDCYPIPSDIPDRSKTMADFFSPAPAPVTFTYEPELEEDRKPEVKDKPKITPY
jgi:hypothetical protein